MNSWASVRSHGRPKTGVKSLVKFMGAAIFTAVVGIFTPQYMHERVDQLWVEEAHQALLTTLVDARNYAWDEGLAVKLCLADAQRQCLSDESEGLAGWRAYVHGPEGITRTVAFHGFHAQNVALTTSALDNWQADFGFDAEGYSLQKEVTSFDIYSLSGVSPKTYKVIVEPSGALQTLVNAKVESNVHVALSDWPERAKELESAL